MSDGGIFEWPRKTKRFATRIDWVAHTAAAKADAADTADRFDPETELNAVEVDSEAEAAEVY